MTRDDQIHWDERYRAVDHSSSEPELPQKFAAFVDLFAAADTALEIACGSGHAAIWLAKQGVQVTAYDISPVAVRAATERAESHGVSDRCIFAIADFDEGLPAGDQVDLVLCHMFREPALDRALVDRLRPQGLLAIAALSEVGASPGRYRVKPGELADSFAHLDAIASAEGDGVAWLVARKP